MIHVVNRNSYNGPGIHITRGNVLGNPYVIGKDGTREQVIELHRQFLWECMHNGSAVGQAIKELAEKHSRGEDIFLICCCSPQPCHGDTIRDAIIWKADQHMREARVIVAGSRSITNYDLVAGPIFEAAAYWQIKIVEIVSGVARGADTLGEQFANQYGIPIKRFPANWNDISETGLVRTNSCGQQYNPAAGHARNEQMAEYATHLVASWDGKSTGTADMILRMHRKNKPVFVRTFMN